MLYWGGICRGPDDGEDSREVSGNSGNGEREKIVLGQMDVRCWDLVHVCIFLLAEKKRMRVLWGFW